MKKGLLLLVFVFIGLGIYWFVIKKTVQVQGKQQEVLKATLHSAPFNASIDSLLNGYFTLKSAFVEADSAQVKLAAKKILLLANQLNLTELKKDTAGIAETVGMQLNDIKANAESLLNQNSLTEMRQDFRMVSESLYPLLKTIHYEGATLYWQNCPMAFGEDKEANWISNTAEIINPYMGKHHPEFKTAMLHCGEVKDSIQAQ